MIEFVPKLSEPKEKAIKNLGFGLMNKIIMEFTECFWPPDTASISFACEEKGKYPWLFNISHDHDKNVLICFLTDHFARKVEKNSD